MKVIKILAAVVCLFMTTLILAQPTKYGHLNSGNLLAMLPEVKIADAQLDAYQKTLVARGDSMVAVFRASYETYQKEAASGNLNKIKIQEKEQELQKMQATIQGYDQEIKSLVLKKREEILKPILKKVDEAVHAVGKEEGYLMIFDESTGAMMYSLSTMDVMPMVKKKLGLN